MLALPLYDDTPKVSTPVATVGLVAACVLVFFWQTGLPPRAATTALYSYGMIPAVIFGSGRAAGAPAGHASVDDSRHPPVPVCRHRPYRGQHAASVDLRPWGRGRARDQAETFRLSSLAGIAPALDVHNPASEIGRGARLWNLNLIGDSSRPASFNEQRCRCQNYAWRRWSSHYWL